MPAKLRLRTGTEDAYLSSLWEAHHNRRGTVVPQSLQSPIQNARTLRQRGLLALHGDNHRHPIDLRAVYETITYVLWWQALIERYSDHEAD